MNRKKTLSRLLLMLRPYLGVLILSILLAAVSVVLTLYAPVLIGDAVDLVIGPGQVSFQPLTALLVQLAIVAGLTALVQWLMGVCNNRLTYHIASDLRSQAFSRLHEMPLSAIDKSSFGDTISRITTDVDQISDGLLMGFNQLFTGVVTILGTLGFMLSIHVGISLVVVVLTPLSFFVASFIARHTFQYFQEQSKVRGDMTSLVEEMVGEQKIVKAFCYETRAAERFEVLNQQLRDCGSKAVFYSSLTNPCTRFVNGLCAVDKDGQIKRAMGPGISPDWFWIVEKPHPLRVEGFPMDSIAVYPGTSRYWVEGDLEDAQQAKGVGPVEGFRRFFTEFAAGDYRPHLEELIWTTTK